MWVSKVGVGLVAGRGMVGTSPHGFTKVGAMRLKSRIIQHRQPKVKKPVVQPKPQVTPRVDNNVVARSRTSNEVSIAHFSKLDQIRAN